MLKTIKALIASAVLLGANAARNIEDTSVNEDGDHWALLIAGSNGWGNYRHQADIYHAFQILKSQGVSEDNIVVMDYDDIANSPENPHPGIIINSPGGSDNYAGVNHDYTGNDVNAANMLYVLGGDASAMTGIGSGKVIASGANDNVFVYFADHGGPGILGTPVPPYLYATDLIATLKAMADGTGNNAFSKLTFYVEACESGSIFDGLLPDDLNIYVTTAANPNESSWGYYCPGMTPAPPAEYNTCLGDLYSISWMENADKFNLDQETLQKQYELVTDRTSVNGTYNQGSHVMQYGQLDWTTEPVGDFVGTGFAGQSNLKKGMMGVTRDMSIGAKAESGAGAVPQRDAELVYFYHAMMGAEEGEAKVFATKRFNDELTARTTLDANMKSTVANVLNLDANHADVSATMTVATDDRTGKAVVDDWDCIKSMEKVWSTTCGQLSQYGMKHMRSFANLCNAGFNAKDLSKSMTCVEEQNPIKIAHN